MQAARGASLTDGGTGGHQPVRHLLVVFVAAGAVLALDVVSKAVAVASLTGREPVRLLDGLLTLRLVRNPGAAFGLAEGSTVALTCIAIVVVAMILRAAHRLRSTPWALALGLVLGGALGNLGDRLFRSPGPLRGHVIDFLEVPHWPVFNVADTAIVTGAVLMAVLSLRGVAYDSSGERAAASPDDE